MKVHLGCVIRMFIYLLFFEGEGADLIWLSSGWNFIAGAVLTHYEEEGVGGCA